MNEDFLELLSSFVAADVRFLVVGAYAVAVHGHPRATADLDVWVDATPENAPRVVRALIAFGAPTSRVTADDFSRPDIVFQIGLPPRRIDVLTEISGVRFEDAWPRRVAARFGDVETAAIGLDDLLANKTSAGRPKDLADVDALRRLR